jgi:hypothetical protein
VRRVQISFYRPTSLIIELTDEQYKAAMDEDDWDDFYSQMEEVLRDHLFAYCEIDDIKDYG